MLGLFTPELVRDSMSSEYSVVDYPTYQQSNSALPNSLLRKWLSKSKKRTASTDDEMAALLMLHDQISEPFYETSDSEEFLARYDSLLQEVKEWRNPVGSVLSLTEFTGSFGSKLIGVEGANMVPGTYTFNMYANDGIMRSKPARFELDYELLPITRFGVSTGMTVFGDLFSNTFISPTLDVAVTSKWFLSITPTRLRRNLVGGEEFLYDRYRFCPWYLRLGGERILQQSEPGEEYISLFAFTELAKAEDGISPNYFFRSTRVRVGAGISGGAARWMRFSAAATYTQSSDWPFGAEFGVSFKPFGVSAEQYVDHGEPLLMSLLIGGASFVLGGILFGP